MKITRRFISLLLTLMICVGLVPMTQMPANAEPIQKEITATIGETVTVKFQYKNIIGVQGVMTLSNPDMFTNAKITTSGLEGSSKYKYDSITVWFYAMGSAPELATITITLTLADGVKPGDKCEINFQYETSVEGVEDPSIPDYKYDVVTITVGVDYRALQAQINRANALFSNEKEYTADSWSKMLVELAVARKALTSQDQNEVDIATANLKKAIDNLVKAPTDYSELKKQIALAEDLRESDYTPSSWANLETALKAARTALTYKDQSKVDKAAKNLKNAIQNLVKVSTLDYSELRRQIARGETLIQSEYTAESWAQFDIAFKAAKKALDAKEQSEINNAATNLKIAIESLVREVHLDYSALLELIAKAEGLNQSDYTNVSWNAMLAALGLAREALNSPIQSEVDTAATNLRNAINNLVSMNFKALLDAIAAVMKYAEDERLADLWMQMHELLNQAEELMNSGDQAAVDQCAKDILDLLAKIVEEMDKLKKVEVIEVTKPAEPEKDYCGIPMHRVWPILFWISLALNVILLVLIIVYLSLKRKRVSDDTPLVDYNIEDDELV